MTVQPSLAEPAGGSETRPVIAFIGLGANLGDAPATLAAASRRLGALPASRLIGRSSRYRSAPLDADGPDFANAVVAIETQLPAARLLAELQAIEAAFGRTRPYRNAPRTLDLDLLTYGNERIDAANLTVPHPRLHLRAFVLAPLAELAPDLDIAGLGPVHGLLANCRDQGVSRVGPLDVPPAAAPGRTIAGGETP